MWDPQKSIWGINPFYVQMTLVVYLGWWKYSLFHNQALQWCLQCRARVHTLFMFLISSVGPLCIKRHTCHSCALGSCSKMLDGLLMRKSTVQHVRLHFESVQTYQSEGDDTPLSVCAVCLTYKARFGQVPCTTRPSLERGTAKASSWTAANITNIVEIDCQYRTVLCSQHNIEFIKTEPDPDAVLYPASCIKSQPVDVEEVKSVLVSFPLMKTGQSAGYFCVCLYISGHLFCIRLTYWNFILCNMACCVWQFSVYKYYLNPALFTRVFFPTLKAVWYITSCTVFYFDVCMCVCVLFVLPFGAAPIMYCDAQNVRWWVKPVA